MMLYHLNWNSLRSLISESFTIPLMWEHLPMWHLVLGYPWMNIPTWVLFQQHRKLLHCLLHLVVQRILVHLNNDIRLTFKDNYRDVWICVGWLTSNININRISCFRNLNSIVAWFGSAWKFTMMFCFCFTLNSLYLSEWSL